MVYEIFFFDFTRGPIVKGFVKSLIVIISFDIFKNREENATDVLKTAITVKTFLSSFPSEASPRNVIPAIS